MPRLKTAVLCVLALAAPVGAAPVRVLLVGGAATREYQFVRNLLLHEAGAGRARLAVYLQTPPGLEAPREGVEQGATLLKKFPEVMIGKRSEDVGDQPDELASYDVIVAFDPDWMQLSADQQKLLKGWVEDGGGLVVVAGPVNTPQLSRKANADKLRPILDLYPVAPGDSRLDVLSDEADRAWPLHFPGADKDAPPFLKLDPEGKGPLAGWDAFFYGDGEEHKGDVERGFYHAYPVDALKPAATVRATLPDPKRKPADGREAPFLAEQAVGKGRVVYLGSGEVWRLRTYREAYYDHFWTGLIRYTAARPKAEAPKESPDELSLEVAALRALYAFEFTPEQRKDLEARAKETAPPARARKTTKVSDGYLQALTELHAALADASDDDAIDAKEDALADVEEKEHPGLEDDLELTPAARRQAAEVFHKLKPSQLAAYLRRQDETADPQDRLVKALAEVRELKRDEWKDQRDAIADDAAEALAGPDAKKAEKISDRVVALLSKARALTADEFKAKQADLEKEAREIAGAAGPEEVLKNRAEYALAELLSNPRLAEALKARAK